LAGVDEEYLQEAVVSPTDFELPFKPPFSNELPDPQEKTRFTKAYLFRHLFCESGGVLIVDDRILHCRLLNEPVTVLRSSSLKCQDHFVHEQRNPLLGRSSIPL